MEAKVEALLCAAGSSEAAAVHIAFQVCLDQKPVCCLIKEALPVFMFGRGRFLNPCRRAGAPFAATSIVSRMKRVLLLKTRRDLHHYLITDCQCSVGSRILCYYSVCVPVVSGTSPGAPGGAPAPLGAGLAPEALTPAQKWQAEMPMHCFRSCGANTKGTNRQSNQASAPIKHMTRGAALLREHGPVSTCATLTSVAAFWLFFTVAAACSCVQQQYAAATVQQQGNRVTLVLI